MTLARGTSLACLAACAAACVPRGDPPAGRQLVADRTAGLAGLVRPNGDGVTRVLVTRAAPTDDRPYALDLYVVSVDATGAPPVERLLANLSSLGSNCSIANDPCTDARGRLFITTGFTPEGFSFMTRIDPLTGDRLELGAVAYILQSPSRERLLVFGSGLTGHPTLYDADDRMFPLDERSAPTFFGEDLYYLAAEQDLMRIAPGGAPERLATGIRSFLPPLVVGNRLMILSRPTADPMVTTLSFLDVVTLEETPSPLGTTPFSLSPDERWLYMYDQEAGRMTFVERTTGARDVLELESFLFGGGGEWRPGHDEIWFSTGDYQNQSITIKVPGGPAVEVPGSAIGPSNEMGFGSMFTSDGVYWFSSASSPIEKPRFQIGSADDPTGPRFDLVPAGASVWQYWRLADGRILTPAYINTPTRNDIYAVDPMTGASSALGEAGAVLAVGQTRLLAMLHINDARGDLTVVDLATGGATILAPEFTLTAAAEPRGADRVAPGAPVAYQFQARFASPYDGIWLATVP